MMKEITTLNENTHTKMPIYALARAPRVIGLDIANSFVKSVSEEGIDIYANTTIVVSESEKRMLLSEGNRKNTIYTYTDEDGITNMYKIGLLERGVVSSFSTSDDRYSSKQFKLEFILALAKKAQNGDVFVVVTGLPSSDYVEAKNKNALKSLANKTYNVKVNDVPVSFSISHIFVELQPRGTYLSSVYSFENGQLILQNEDLITTKSIGILDIGWGTSDFALITTSGDLKDTIGISYGMSNAFTMLKDNLIGEFKALKNISLNEIEAELRETGQLWAGGKLIDKERVTRELERVYSVVTSNIMSQLKNQIDLDDLNVCIFTGGGVVSLREHLRPHMDGEYRKLLAANPQYSNAEGYFIRGLLIQQQGGF